jgi:lysophospholipid acyltransferase (LPLAT)-like uncharacterized protein
MKLRHPWLIPLAAFLTTCVVWLWMRTVRYRYQMPRTPVHPNDPKLEGRYIYGLWHENLMITAGVRFQGRILTLISQHADGEFVARVSRNLGYVPVRGSSTRGGAKAMLELLRESQRSHVFVTPDGPRGPRRRVQQGMVYLASRTGLPIVPVGIGYQNAWRLRSWDRFGIPLPGSLAIAVGGEPIPVPPDLDREGLESYRILVEEAMLAATAAAEALATGKTSTDAAAVSHAPRAAA